MSDYVDWYDELSNAVWIMLGENLEDSLIPEDAVVSTFEDGYTPEEAVSILYREFYEGEDDDDDQYFYQ